MSLRARLVVPWTVPITRTRWLGSVEVVDVRREGVRDGWISVSNVRGAVDVSGG